jgi:DNA uptake protein ComE-like DNA-binding protein
LLLSNLVSGRDALLRVLNSGSLKELMNLQTIGKKRAQLILAKRDELMAATGGGEAGGNAYVTLADLAHIGLSETQIEQFTQRNIIANIIAGATAMEE